MMAIFPLEYTGSLQKSVTFVASDSPPALPRVTKKKFISTNTTTLYRIHS